MSAENRAFGRSGVAIAAIALLFVAPYDPALSAVLREWRYLVADVAIAGVVAWRYRAGALRHMGLAVPPRHLAAALVVFALASLAAHASIAVIGAQQGLAIDGRRPWFSLSQVVHQEIVLRGLLLGWMGRFIPRRMLLALVAAAVFAAVHPLHLWWVEGIPMTPRSLLTLLAFGAIANLLFLRVGHVGFSCALHAAWNLARFGTHLTLGGAPLTQARSFAYIEGSALACGAAVAALCVALVVEGRAPGGFPARVGTSRSAESLPSTSPPAD